MVNLFSLILFSMISATAFARAPTSSIQGVEIDYEDFKCLDKGGGRWQVTNVNSKVKVGFPFKQERECQAALQTTRDDGSFLVCTPTAFGGLKSKLYDLRNGKAEVMPEITYCRHTKNARAILEKPDNPNTVGTAREHPQD